MKRLIISLMIGLVAVYVLYIVYKDFTEPEAIITKTSYNITDYKETWYYEGQILYPDNMHKDTLIVIRANFLNKILHGSKMLNTNKNENLGPDDIDDDTITIENKDNKDDLLINNPSSVSIPTLLSTCCIALNGRKLSYPTKYDENNQTDDLSAIVTDNTVTISFQ